MNRLGGVQAARGPFQVHMAKVRVPLTWVVLGWMGRRVGALVALCGRRPAIIPAFVAVLVAWQWTTDNGPLPLLVMRYRPHRPSPVDVTENAGVA